MKIEVYILFLYMCDYFKIAIISVSNFSTVNDSELMNWFTELLWHFGSGQTIDN
jgi:hypothetical protein